MPSGEAFYEGDAFLIFTWGRRYPLPLRRCIPFGNAAVGHDSITGPPPHSQNKSQLLADHRRAFVFYNELLFQGGNCKSPFEGTSLGFSREFASNAQRRSSLRREASSFAFGYGGQALEQNGQKARKVAKATFAITSSTYTIIFSSRDRIPRCVRSSAPRVFSLRSIAPGRLVLWGFPVFFSRT